MIHDDCFLVDQHHYETASLAEQATFNRINALTAIYRAKRGWIGASLSAAEILTSLYFEVADIGPDPLTRDRIVLGKGHAAAMQYACLAGRGLIPTRDLLKYKHADGPQAHTDITTAGIDVNTGSLGQALSKCCGLAMSSTNNVYVILGDGELQEGQNFEAFMTVNRYRPPNLTIVIDRNGLQSDSNVDDIMAIPDLSGVLEGLGLDVVEVDGQDVEAVRQTLLDSSTVPARAIIANTQKGAGISFMAADTVERRQYDWHGGVPDAKQYRDALVELTAEIENEQVCSEITGVLQREIVVTPTKEEGPTSTGVAFGQELVRLADGGLDIFVFDADLEKSCRLTDFAARHPARFIEMGISEQDMVSCAGGFALQGRVPVVNTYAAFYRRAYEQVYVNATEHTRIIYAGHYAGLCYAFDGKTHQCTGDVAMMRAIPGMTVLYPAFPEEIPRMLEWYRQSDVAGPLYIRLHRTPPLSELPTPAGGVEFEIGRGIQLSDNGSDTVVLTSGPHMAAFCAEASSRCGLDAYAISSLRPLAVEFVRALFDRYVTIHVVEEIFDAGGLFDEVCHVAAKLQPRRWPSVHQHAVDDFTHSTLEADGLYKHFGLVVEGICEKVKATGARE